MEKWKIAVILALLAALPIFGYLQNAQEKSAANTPAAPTPSPLLPPANLQPLIGKTPPPLTIPQQDWMNTSKPINFEDYKGKVVLLEFWRHECSHCQEAAPFVEELAKGMKAQGLEVIGVQSPSDNNKIEANWPALKKELAAKGVKHPMAFDRGRKNFSKYKAEKFPTFVLIGPDGTVVYANHGFTPPQWQKLIEEVQKALKKVTGAK